MKELLEDAMEYSEFNKIFETENIIGEKIISKMGFFCLVGFGVHNKSIKKIAQYFSIRALEVLKILANTIEDYFPNHHLDVKKKVWMCSRIMKNYGIG